MTTIIDGKKLSETELEVIEKEIKGLDMKPRLDIVIVGSDESSLLYVGLKKKQGEKIGAEVHIHHFEKISLSNLLDEINNLNEDKNVNGFIVQMPIPEEALELDIAGITYWEAIRKIHYAIEPMKDADGMSTKSVGKVLHGFEDATIPATAKAVLKVLEEVYKTSNLISALAGKDILIINRSNIVGKPLAAALINLDATVTMAHSKTEKIEEKIGSADIVISGTGISKFIKGNMIRKGAVVIDIGITKGKSGVAGDVEKTSVVGKASFLTPVPGGVGPLTVAMLFENLVKLTKLNSK